eukprot:gb/GECH01011352.1/.p1 GENE.gb/GECH01011352.1/~~gb/GECH01011352.1/.p1  ORF type:complete len:142 (+),score=33.13 gb/GECH01011352.1/:1-426(+)
MKVSRFMTPKDKVSTCSKDTLVKDIAKVMLDKHIGSYVVLENDKAVGIITKTDLVRSAFVNFQDCGSVTAADVMSSNVKTIPGEMQRDEVAEKLRKEHVHHMIIADSEGNFQGITSAWDVVKEAALDAKAFPYNREHFMFK